MSSDRPGNEIKSDEGLRKCKLSDGFARQSDISHSTIVTILKNKNKVTEAVKGSVSLKATKLTKNQEGPIFNKDKTSLFWKRMPERTFIHKEAKSVPGFKAFEDTITVLLWTTC
jgi:hypothetical protein